MASINRFAASWNLPCSAAALITKKNRAGSACRNYQIVKDFRSKDREMSAVGFTDLRLPLVNFTIRNRNSREAFDPRLQGIVGGYISVQIHELGNSIFSLSGGVTGLYDGVRTYNGGQDYDDGYQLERCVTDELKKMGY